MAEWLIRATKQHITSVSPRQMEKRYGGSFVDGNGKGRSNPTAIMQPDMSAVAGIEKRYWLVTGDVITQMNQTARDVVDAAREERRKDAIVDMLDHPDHIASTQVVLDEINALRAHHGDLPKDMTQHKADVRSKL